MTESSESTESNELLQFESIISDKTHYGIIWEGTYENKVCVVKVVILNTGVHYNKKEGKYYDGENHISKRRALKLFSKNREAPYLHTRYVKKKAMDIDVFYHEVKMIKNVGKLGLAPKLFDHWVDRTTSRIHYGIIVMEKLERTVKDILINRNLRNKELNYILDKINNLHDNGIKHGDLKPSNIGVYCDKLGEIIKVKIIDWAKGDYTNDNSLFVRDIKTFHAHVKKNIKER